VTFVGAPVELHMPPAATNRASRRAPAGPPKPPPPESEIAFSQANFGRTGNVTPGELLCHMCVECGGSRPNAIECFLIMDVNGDGKISRDEWDLMFKRCSSYGLRAKPQPPAAHSPDEIKALNTEALGLIEPQVAKLRTAFDALDLNKDGFVSSRELAAFQIVLDRTTRREQVIAENEKAAAELAATGAPPVAPKPMSEVIDSVKLPDRMRPMLDVDANEALATRLLPQRGPPQGAAAPKFKEDNGFSDAYTLDFDHFKSLLMRHAAAIDAAPVAGAAKGKKKK